MSGTALVLQPSAAAGIAECDWAVDGMNLAWRLLPAHPKGVGRFVLLCFACRAHAQLDQLEDGRDRTCRFRTLANAGRAHVPTNAISAS